MFQQTFNHSKYFENENIEFVSKKYYNRAFNFIVESRKEIFKIVVKY